MALSTDEKTYIRQNNGDNAATPKLSDAVLQAIYDNPAEGNADLDRTVFFSIRRLYALAVAKFTNLTSPVTGLSVARSPEFDNYQKLLNLWSDITGIPVRRALTADIAHVYRADSLQTEAPDYSSGTDDD